MQAEREKERETDRQRERERHTHRHENRKIYFWRKICNECRRHSMRCA